MINTIKQPLAHTLEQNKTNGTRSWSLNSTNKYVTNSLHGLNNEWLKVRSGGRVVAMASVQPTELTEAEPTDVSSPCLVQQTLKTTQQKKLQISTFDGHSVSLASIWSHVTGYTTNVSVAEHIRLFRAKLCLSGSIQSATWPGNARRWIRRGSGAENSRLPPEVGESRESEPATDDGAGGRSNALWRRRELQSRGWFRVNSSLA